ncbi:MAG TPA: NAD(P)-binding domain-containing protein, partial [Solirubrobacterales bacterium]|nr:NAD(P)-binding domain-containing protein [Solirubrobacterales bacterium]
MQIGIVGLGYVGLPLAAAFAEAGHRVSGFDVDRDRVERLNRGESDVEDVPSAALAAFGDRFTASA